jgi:hypothetical protein
MTAHTRIFLLMVLAGMGCNAALYLALWLPTSPFKVSIWSWIYTVVLPYLGILGAWGWLRQKELDLPPAIPLFLVVYTLLLTLWVNSFYIGLAGVIAHLPSNSAEIFHLVLFALTFGGILYVLRQEYYW